MATPSKDHTASWHGNRVLVRASAVMLTYVTNLQYVARIVLRLVRRRKDNQLKEEIDRMGPEFELCETLLISSLPVVEREMEGSEVYTTTKCIARALTPCLGGACSALFGLIWQHCISILSVNWSWTKRRRLKF